MRQVVLYCRKVNGEAGEAAMSKTVLDAMLVAPESKAVMEACGRRVEQVREFSDIWMAGLQRTIDSSLDLAAQVTRCTDMAEAMRLYSAWANDCRDRLFADGRSASEMWVKALRSDAELLLSIASQQTQPLRAAAAE